MKTAILLLSLFALPNAHAESCVRFKKCYKVISHKNSGDASRYGFSKGSIFVFEQSRCDSLEYTFLNGDMFDTTKWHTDGKCHPDGQGRVTIDDEKVTHYGYSKGVCPKLSDQAESEIMEGKDGKLTFSFFDSEGKVYEEGVLEPTSESPKWMQDDFSCK